MTEQFREYLQYQPFTVRTDNNPLTYILTTPNLDALGHRWVAALAGYNMKLEYLKGADNKIADTLSRLPPEKLDEHVVAELLDYAHNSYKPRAETANMNIIEEAERMDQEVIVRYSQIMKQHKNFRNLANLDWVESQGEDPVIPTVINWVKRPKGDKSLPYRVYHTRVYHTGQPTLPPGYPNEQPGLRASLHGPGEGLAGCH